MQLLIINVRVCKVQEGDYCSTISVQFGITLEDFYFLNPQLDTACSNLWLHTSYCVKPVGNIETYPGYPVSMPSTSFTKPPRTTSYTPVPVETPPLSPKAPGSLQDCFSYENSFGPSSEFPDYVDTCSRRATFAGISVEQLIAWNPSLTWENCVLQEAYSYCTRRWETPRKLHKNCSSQSSELFQHGN
jgi:hypothetical protein